MPRNDRPTPPGFVDLGAKPDPLYSRDGLTLDLQSHPVHGNYLHVAMRSREAHLAYRLAHDAARHTLGAICLAGYFTHAERLTLIAVAANTLMPAVQRQKLLDLLTMIEKVEER